MERIISARGTAVEFASIQRLISRSSPSRLRTEIVSHADRYPFRVPAVERCFVHALLLMKCVPNEALRCIPRLKLRLRVEGYIPAADQLTDLGCQMGYDREHFP